MQEITPHEYPKIRFFSSISLAILIHVLFVYTVIFYSSKKKLDSISHKISISLEQIAKKNIPEQHIQRKIIAQQKKSNKPTRKKTEPFKSKILTSNESLKNFLPGVQQITQWREEGANLNSNQSAFLYSNLNVDKSYPKMLLLAEVLKDQFDIPEILRKPFYAAEVKIKIIKNSEGKWVIDSVYGKNSYFRSFVYESVKKIILDSNKTKVLSKIDSSIIYITWNYFKIKSNDDVSLEKRSQVANNTISFSFVDKVKPDEYKIISGNILSIADYIVDKALPDLYQDHPEIIDLRKSYAFSHEGVIPK